MSLATKHLESASSRLKPSVTLLLPWFRILTIGWTEYWLNKVLSDISKFAVRPSYTKQYSFIPRSKAP